MKGHFNDHAYTVAWVVLGVIALLVFYLVRCIGG